MKRSRTRIPPDPRCFTLAVRLTGGPVSETFVAANPEVMRVIEIRGDQVLADLHDAIFEAFEREDEHLYEFQIGGKGRNRVGARRYAIDMGEDHALAGDPREVAIGTLGLKPKDRFGYWFDFGDDWMHEIRVQAIADGAPARGLPRVVQRIGASPPQYEAWDEDEEDSEDDSAPR